MDNSTEIAVVTRLSDEMAGLGQTARQAARAVSDIGWARGAVKSVGAMAYEALHGLDQAARAGKRLRDALRGVGTAGRAALDTVKGFGQAGAGVTAGAMVAGRALAKPVAFEKRLALMANTAYADRDVAGRIKGMQGLADAVNTALRQGGGDRDQAAEALDAMLTSGAVKVDAAKRLLPTIQKAATASGTSPREIAAIVIQGMQQGFFTEGQAGQALDKAMAAGQAGGFALRDSAKWLPKLMASGSGMRSMAGFEQILAYAQVAAVTAGSGDEAGSDLANLLRNLNSQGTQENFSKLGIDLNGALTRAREQGMLPLEAIANLVDKEMASRDPRYKALQKRLASAKGDEKRRILSDMADLANASAVGEVFQNRQALRALIAANNQKDSIQNVLEQIRNSRGTNDKAYQVYRSTTGARMESTANEAEIARSRMLQDVSGPLKAVADAATDLAQRFPTLTTLATEAATGLGAVAEAFAGAGAFSLFAGGGGGGLTAAIAKGAGKNLLRGVPLLVAGAEALATEANPTLSRAQKNIRHAETAGETAFAIAGAKVGAMAGTAVAPGVGTFIGMILGGIGGYMMGGKAGRDTGQWIWGDQAGQDASRVLHGAHKAWGLSGQAMNDAQRIVVEDRSTIHLESVLHVDGHEMARVVNNYNTADAKRE
ncbi:tail tape measure protein TP901 core region [Solidesulfovibrio fructosivorans JJ]]|uniref:Tail tape measure protein TP901 core region n=1 Tax=Solidesulfovibrio fructosivorans JJ] TaxID=596151 RepID=E1JUA0_SOLFR|nr:phage tail tape measure protein [Solidesulfovibrio fructosivorans]EFL52030.1 tail tape measure protein TP901 core region [Solidesulfovibrio fructosivorans JJ]]